MRQYQRPYVQVGDEFHYDVALSTSSPHLDQAAAVIVFVTSATEGFGNERLFFARSSGIGDSQVPLRQFQRKPRSFGKYVPLSGEPLRVFPVASKKPYGFDVRREGVGFFALYRIKIQRFHLFPE